MKVKKSEILQKELSSSWNAMIKSLDLHQDTVFNEIMYQHPWLWAVWNDGVTHGNNLK